MAVFQPRSLVENQCTSTRPLGGHPIPWNQPLMNIMIAKIAIEPVSAGTKATNRFATADRARPMGMK